MNLKRLKELIEHLPDDMEVFIRNSENICGNIGELEQVEKSAYGFLGDTIPCLILNTQYTEKKLEKTGFDSPFFKDYIENDGLKH